MGDRIARIEEAIADLHRLLNRCPHEAGGERCERPNGHKGVCVPPESLFGNRRRSAVQPDLATDNNVDVALVMTACTKPPVDFAGCVLV